AMMYDDHADSILHELSPRDNEANADLFGLILDTYNDDINGYGFFTTAAGVQIDARYSTNGQDFNWNAVWQSQVKINEKGWVAEYRIPYSALRFPKDSIQDWGVNFIRKVRRTREDDFWNEVNPEVSGFINQFGDLGGIADIQSPLRLSITPYIVGYAETHPSELGNGTEQTYSLNGGMDIKYGINESFTLDMTLVPDFGQVQSDNKILNLSPFEVKYDENRPFFTEGTELFNKGGLFYSRRVGATPIDYDKPYDELNDGEKVKDNPTTTQLINATKLSGRTEGNLGVGVFNATTAATYATVIDTVTGAQRKIMTSPLTNYNVFVLDQALKNNSYISLINTNVTRDGKAYDANVTGTAFKFADKKNKYDVDGTASVSQLYFSDSSKPVLGYAYNVYAGKISGKFQYYANANVKSDKYNPNDLGILFINNTIETNLHVSYNKYEPFWKINQYSLSGGVGYSRLFKPSFLWNFDVYGNAYVLFKSFLSTGGGFNFEPIKTYDHWEPRVVGHYYVFPKDYLGNYWFSSDYRKRFALDGGITYRYFEENNRYNIEFFIAPRFRVNNKLSFNYNFDRSFANDDIGFVHYDGSDVITFGRRNVLTITNTLNASYIFTNRMSLSLRVRHYWSKAEYKEYYTLGDKGSLFEDSQYTGNSNVNFNAFNIDMVYSWQFLPGSEIDFVWKNAVYTQGDFIYQHFSDDIDKTFNSPQSNSFSIKVLYYLDYSMLKRRNKKK
ncbi:MAG: DUF5916 domain-containing protein, partial [Bacteroidia bacterium]